MPVPQSKETDWLDAYKRGNKKAASPPAGPGTQTAESDPFVKSLDGFKIGKISKVSQAPVSPVQPGGNSNKVYSSPTDTSEAGMNKLFADRETARSKKFGGSAPSATATVPPPAAGGTSALDEFGNAISYKVPRETTEKGFKQLQSGEVAPGLLNTALGIGQGFANTVFGIPEAVIKLVPGAHYVTDAVDYPFQKVGQVFHDAPDAISQLLEKTGVAKGLRKLLPGVSIDPVTAKKLTDPIKDIVSFGSQMMLGEGIAKGIGAVKAKAGIPDNISELKAADKASAGRTGENWTEAPVVDQPNIPSESSVTPEGTIQQAPVNRDILKSKKSEIQKRLEVLQKRRELTDNKTSQPLLDKAIEAHESAIKQIDQTLNKDVVKQTIIPDAEAQTSDMPPLDLDKLDPTPKPIDQHIIESPVEQLPGPIADKIRTTADDLQAQIKDAHKESEGSSFRFENEGGGYTTQSAHRGYTVSYFPEWFSKLGKSKNEIIKALQKIKEDAGKDKGVLVEDLKDVILSRLKGEEEDVLHSWSGKKHDYHSFGKIPGDPEIIDFINGIDKNLSIKQLHEEYDKFERLQDSR